MMTLFITCIFFFAWWRYVIKTVSGNKRKKSLVYGISSFSSAYTDTGMFGIYCGTGENQIQELIPVFVMS